MKIVFLAPFGLRPKGTLLARMLPLAKELQALGDQVVIIAPPYTNPEDSGVTETVDEVRLVNIHLSRLGKTLGAPLLAWRMVRAAQVEQPDLVHLFKPKGYGGLAAMWFCLIRRLGLKSPPLFVDTDDWEGRGGMNDLHDYSLPEKLLFAFQEKWLLRQALGVTLASRALQAQVRALRVPDKSLLYLPNCVHERDSGDGSLVRHKHGIDSDKPVVLLYTRFFEFCQGRLHFVLHAIAEQKPEVLFMVVGQGRKGEEISLARAADDMSFSENLLQVGWVNPNQIPDYLAAADAAIYPLDDNLVNRAKCPAKLTEIMLSGCPVVADRVGQTQEYLQHGENGLLVNPDKPEEMAEAVVALLGNKTRRNTLGAQARISILEDFNWSHAAKRLDDFYERLLNE